MPAKTKKAASAPMTLADAMLALEKEGSAQTRKTCARHGDTACKTPEAGPTIDKAWAHSI